MAEVPTTTEQHDAEQNTTPKTSTHSTTIPKSSSSPPPYLVPFLRSHVRRFCKAGDLIQVKGGQWITTTTDKNKNNNTNETDDDDDGFDVDVDANYLRKQFVLTVHTLQQAQESIQILQTRYWTPRQVQQYQAYNYIPPSPTMSVRDPSRRTTLSFHWRSPGLYSNESNTECHLPVDVDVDDDRDPRMQQGQHSCHISHNTGLAKRTQASCVANFLMHAIFHSMCHATTATGDRHEDAPYYPGGQHPSSTWAQYPLMDPNRVQSVLNEGHGVLDIAGGSGYLAMALALRGVRATVLDPRSNVGKLPKRDRKLFVLAQEQQQRQPQRRQPQRTAQQQSALQPQQDVGAAAAVVTTTTTKDHRPAREPPLNTSDHDDKNNKNNKNPTKDNSEDNSNQRDDDKDRKHQARAERLWRKLLFPAQSSFKPPPLSTTMTNAADSVSSWTTFSSSDNNNHPKDKNNINNNTSSTNTATTMVHPPLISQMMDLSHYYCYCQPVQSFDSYQAWFGGLPPPESTDDTVTRKTSRTKIDTKNTTPLRPPGTNTTFVAQSQLQQSRQLQQQQQHLPICDETNPLFQQASALVALHPDEATDAIVDLAVAYRIPFAVVPCCVYSRLFPHRRRRRQGHGNNQQEQHKQQQERPQGKDPQDQQDNVNSNQIRNSTSQRLTNNNWDDDDGLVRTLADLLDYLQAKDPSIRRATLPFGGANTVLWSTFELQRFKGCASTENKQ